jgi:hypothetical protein
MIQRSLRERQVIYQDYFTVTNGRELFFGYLLLFALMPSPDLPRLSSVQVPVTLSHSLTQVFTGRGVSWNSIYFKFPFARTREKGAGDEGISLDFIIILFPGI